jgi:hypothetical protein
MYERLLSKYIESVRKNTCGVKSYVVLDIIVCQDVYGPVIDTIALELGKNGVISYTLLHTFVNFLIKDKYIRNKLIEEIKQYIITMG